jgi:hypothetical protein
MFAAIAALVALSGEPAPELSQRDAELARRTIGQPAAVKAFVERAAACWHWWGEVGHTTDELSRLDDATRGRELDIQRQLRALTCNELERDGRRLAVRYPKAAPLLLQAVNSPL